MTPRGSVLGWLGAATTAAALLTGATALAITARPARPVMLDLGLTPPASAAVAAIAEAAPHVVDEAPALDTPPAPIEDTAPPAAMDAPAAVPPISLPKPQVLSQSDLAIPAQDPPPKPPEPRQQAKADKPQDLPDPKPARTKAKEKPQKPTEKTAATKPAKQPAKPTVSAGPAAPQKGQKAKGGAAKMSSAAYAKAVMKKVRATKKKSGAGKGVVVVGFTVAGNGGLAGVKVIRSSGNAALDKIAVNHIQRSAPFPTPPEGAGRSFSFEFVGK